MTQLLDPLQPLGKARFFLHELVAQLPLTLLVRRGQLIPLRLRAPQVILQPGEGFVERQARPAEPVLLFEEAFPFDRPLLPRLAQVGQFCRDLGQLRARLAKLGLLISQ